MSFDVTTELSRFYDPDRPRRIHYRIASLSGDNLEQVIVRSLHTCPDLMQLVRLHSAAIWTDLTVVIVPTLALHARSVSVSVCVTGSLTAPSTIAALRNCSTCQISQSGGDGVLPSVVRFPVSFEDSGTSPLILPTPHVLPQPAVTLQFSCTDSDELVAGDVYFEVYLEGRVAFRGAGSV